jgi:surfeit locus 1 family protein
MPFFFRLRLIPLFATIAMVALGVSLGQWQSQRAAEKENIASAMQQRSKMPALQSSQLLTTGSDNAFRRVVLHGRFVHGWPLYLDNRPLHGVAGFYVMMPFSIEGSDQHVLVLRGWQPRNPVDRLRMPELVTPKGELVLEGVIRSGVDRVMQLGQPGVILPGAIVQNLSLADVSKQTHLKMLDFVVEQTSASSDRLLRDWPVPSAGADKHRGYAFQWYALALMAVIFFVVTGFRRGKNR